MNWLTMLGFACLDPTFRTHLYKDVDKAARAYGFHLPKIDSQVAKTLFSTQKPIEADFMRVQTRICTRPPCRASDDVLSLIGALLMDPDLLKELFADPVVFLRDHGFHFHHWDIYFLTTLLGQNKDELNEDFLNLSKKIRQLQESRHTFAAA